MLDFYIINDEQVKPEYPEQVELKFAGGIGFSKFNSLIKKGFIDSKYDYYEDFRWKNQVVKEIKLRMEGNLDSDLNDLREIVTQAVNSDSGLIAYCD